MAAGLRLLAALAAALAPADLDAGTAPLGLLEAVAPAARACCGKDLHLRPDCLLDALRLMQARPATPLPPPAHGRPRLQRARVVRRRTPGWGGRRERSPARWFIALRADATAAHSSSSHFPHWVVPAGSGTRTVASAAERQSGR